MRTFDFPAAVPPASAVILGLMRISALEKAEVRSLVSAALDAGITMFDHADVYGAHRHECEERFGEAVHLSPAEREKVLVQTKTGIREGYFDFSAEHILASVDESLAALGLDYLDVLLLHRPDALVEPDEVAQAFDTLFDAGKVRAFGVSNHTPGQIELLKRSVRQPLFLDQVQLSITHAPLIAQGVAANMAGLDQSISRDVGLLDYARLNDITLQAWSPFQRGFFDGVFLGDREHHAELNDAIDELAAAHAVPPAAIAVAWILRHPARMQVVLGTTSIRHLADAAAGADVELSRQEWYRLFTAAGHILP